MSINNLRGELITPLATHANAAIAASRVRAHPEPLDIVHRETRTTKSWAERSSLSRRTGRTGLLLENGPHRINAKPRHISIEGMRRLMACRDKGA
jgi:hypothetical protein